jgi:hypothetical protein
MRPVICMITDGRLGPDAPSLIWLPASGRPLRREFT